ncbi:MAG: hypothetical protein ACXWSC_21780 [Bdellovibrionota bacterium]
MMSPETRKSKRFRLHSIAVELRGRGADRLAQDFDFFTDRPSRNEDDLYSVILEIVAREPARGDLPATEASRVFPDCVLYKDGAQLCYEYHGAAVLRVTRDSRSSLGQLICADEDLAQELGYLYLQSEIGRFLDAQGLHRVHALGLALPTGESALVLLPSGGGKSTLAAEALQSGRVQLLSDDTPLVDRFGNVHPYPLRLSFRAGARLPEAWKEKSTDFHRRKHGSKLLIPTSALPAHSLPRPGEKFRPGYLIVARRHGQRAEPRLERLSRWRGAGPLLRDLVVGLGVPQVAELVLTEGALSLPGLAPTAASRFAAAAAFLARARAYQFDLSRDPTENARFLLEKLAQGNP